MTNMTTNITPLEAETLVAILMSEFHDQPLDKRAGAAVWSFSATLSRKDRAGALGSLAKKGLAESQDYDDDPICWLTEEGHRIAMEIAKATTK